MIKRLAILVFGLLTLSACGLDELAPKDDVEFAKQYLALFQTRDYDAIVAKMDEREKADVHLRMTLERMAGYFPQGAPVRVALVGWESTAPPTGPPTETFKFYYEFTYQKLLATIIFEKHDKDRIVTGLNVAPASPDIRLGVDLMSLGKMSANEIVFLALMVIVPIFTLVALAICIQTRMSKWKWAWCAVIPIGIVSFSLDTTSGEIVVRPIAFMLFGAAINETGYGVAGPSLSVAIPVGAILFLILRWSWRQTAPGNTGQQS